MISSQDGLLFLDADGNPGAVSLGYPDLGVAHRWSQPPYATCRRIGRAEALALVEQAGADAAPPPWYWGNNKIERAA